MTVENTLPLNEMNRCQVDDRTIQSVYHTGRSVITVTSVFGTAETYSDLLCRIIQRKLNLI